MAGAVLTQSERELAQMSDDNFLALKTKAGQLKEALALNADLRAKMALMQKSIDVLTDQRTTAEGQIKRLLDLLERTQAQLDAAMALVNVARQSRGRLVRACREAMRQRSASKKRLMQAESVVAAAIIVSQEAQQVSIDENDGTYAIPSASIYRLDAYLEEIGIDQFIVATLKMNETTK